MPEKVEDGSAITAFGPPSEEEIAAVAVRHPSYNNDQLVEQVLIDKMEDHIDRLTTDEIIERYSHEPSFNWNLLPSHATNDIGYHDVSSRDHEWFACVTGGVLRGRPKPDDTFAPRGLPPGLSTAVERECKNWEGDAHTHSWLAVEEILAAHRLKPFRHYQWIKKFIPDPSRTRMVFFFDN